MVKIGKENTFQNSERDFPNLLPSEFAKELLDSSKVKIDNPNLIRMLNESAINKSPFSIGVRATIYLGERPLNYQSSETSPNWEYQKVLTPIIMTTAGDNQIIKSITSKNRKK